MSRWTLTDPATSEVWEMPINPDRMTSPYPTRSFTYGLGLRMETLHWRTARTFESKPAATSWQWEGVIHTEEHYETYVQWASKPGLINVLDHLGRTWEVMLESFAPEERRPSARTDWRFRYTVKCLILRRIS